MHKYRNKLMILIGLSVFTCIGCKQEVSSNNTSAIIGKTMGTTYSIKTNGKNVASLQQNIDSILLAINLGASTYIEESIISQFNQSEQTFTLKLNENYVDHFWENLKVSKEIYDITSGSFDPSCMPLVNYWGFGYTEKRPVKNVDSIAIEKILSYVGLDKLIIETTEERIVLKKPHEEFQLDFSAIAKGYAVDVLAEFIESKGIQNYMVEIGGEVKVKGKNSTGANWSIGINKPDKKARTNEIQWIVNPKNQGLASSGNYRNFHDVEGGTYGHAINPLTGYPEQKDILGSSILHTSCMYADAYATAAMIMGQNEFSAIISDKKIKACLIYRQADSLKTAFHSGFDSYILNTN